MREYDMAHSYNVVARDALLENGLAWKKQCVW